MTSKLTSIQAYKLPDNFNIRKASPDDMGTSKEEAIERRANELRHFVDGKIIEIYGKTIAGLISTALEYLPFANTVYSAVVRHQAKKDVSNALAKRRIELLSNNGEINKEIEKTVKTFKETTQNNIYITNKHIFDTIPKTEIFRNYFKNKHMVYLVNTPQAINKISSYENSPIDKQIWNEFKLQTQNKMDRLLGITNRLTSSYGLSLGEIEQMVVNLELTQSLANDEPGTTRLDKVLTLITQVRDDPTSIKKAQQLSEATEKTLESFTDGFGKVQTTKIIHEALDKELKSNKEKTKNSLIQLDNGVPYSYDPILMRDADGGGIPYKIEGANIIETGSSASDIPFAEAYRLSSRGLTPPNETESELINIAKEHMQKYLQPLINLFSQDPISSLRESFRNDLWDFLTFTLSSNNYNVLINGEIFALVKQDLIGKHNQSLITYIDNKESKKIGANNRQEFIITDDKLTIKTTQYMLITTDMGWKSNSYLKIDVEYTIPLKKKATSIMINTQKIEVTLLQKTTQINALSQENTPAPAHASERIDERDREIIL